MDYKEKVLQWIKDNWYRCAGKNVLNIDSLEIFIGTLPSDQEIARKMYVNYVRSREEEEGITFLKHIDSKEK